MNSRFKLILLSLIVLTVSSNANAQTYEDVIKAFNEGYQFVKDSKSVKAKAKFFEVIKPWTHCLREIRSSCNTKAAKVELFDNVCDPEPKSDLIQHGPFMEFLM